MFELIMLVGFLAAAGSQLLPEQKRTGRCAGMRPGSSQRQRTAISHRPGEGRHRSQRRPSKRSREPLDACFGTRRLPGV